VDEDAAGEEPIIKSQEQNEEGTVHNEGEEITVADDSGMQVDDEQDEMHKAIFGSDDESEAQLDDTAAKRSVPHSVRLSSSKSINREVDHEITLPDLPRPSKKSQIYVVKLPNILGIEHSPYDPEIYTPPDPVNFEDETKRLRIRPENFIRWRYKKDENGNLTTEKESNARFVRWSDGSLQLLLGNEAIEVSEQNISQENHYLFTRIGGAIVCQGKLNHKLIFRPSGLDSGLHKRLTDFLKTQKIRKDRKTKIVATTSNPEQQKEKQDKMEKDLMKANRKLANSRRRVTRAIHEGLSENFLDDEDEYGEEEDEEQYGDEGNIGAIKATYKPLSMEKSKKKPRIDLEREQEAERKITEAKRNPPTVQVPKKRETKLIQETTAPESEKKRTKHIIDDDEEEASQGETKKTNKKESYFG